MYCSLIYRNIYVAIEVNSIKVLEGEFNLKLPLSEFRSYFSKISIRWFNPLSTRLFLHGKSAYNSNLTFMLQKNITRKHFLKRFRSVIVFRTICKTQFYITFDAFIRSISSQLSPSHSIRTNITFSFRVCLSCS